MYFDEDLSYYLNPIDKDTRRKQDAQVFGFVSKAEDSVPFTKNSFECYENLRLDYIGTQYKNPNQAIYLIRFTDGTNYEIPFSDEFGGRNKDAQPCTGNGFIGSEVCIPEYKVLRTNEKGAVITDGEIYRLHPDGKEELVATFDKKDHCFVKGGLA